MKLIEDADGRQWKFELNVYEFKRTRPTFGDLLDPVYFWDKIGDAVFLTDLLFALVETDAKERGVDEISFEKAFKGDALDAARNALLEEYVDFFPKSNGVKMRAALTKIEEAREKTRTLALDDLNRATANLDAAIRGETETSRPDAAKKRGVKSPNSSASSDSETKR